ncbi:unnamed protein product, partial [Vitis vinifera]
MQLMSVDGLTRENVASHLQKYRLYLKRMQGLSAGGGGRASSEHFLPFVPVAASSTAADSVPSPQAGGTFRVPSKWAI